MDGFSLPFGLPQRSPSSGNGVVWSNFFFFGPNQSTGRKIFPFLSCWVVDVSDVHPPCSLNFIPLMLETS